MLTNVGSDFSDSSDADPSTNENPDGERQSRTQVQTPLTPISSTDSPKLPSNRKTIPCAYSGCDKTFNRQAKLVQHLNSHTNTRPFICPHKPCTKTFLRSSHLKHHVKSAHTEVRDYVCDLERCGKSFVTSTRLKRHQEQHVKRQRFACAFTACGQEFRKHNTLQKHIAIVHDGKRRPFVCEYHNHNETACGASFDKEGNLRNHVNSTHSGSKFYCSICSADEISFPTLSVLQAHIKTDHPPTCLECGSNFASNETLRLHIEAKHSNIDVGQRKKFPCLEPGCGRSFISKSNRNKHLRHIHEEARSFVCGMVDPKSLLHVQDWDGSNACGRALSSKYNLVGHIRTVHLGLGRLRRFGRQEAEPHRDDEALMRLTGIGYAERRELACLIEGCTHRFPREYDLQRHLQSAHGLEELDAGTSMDRPLQQPHQLSMSSLENRDNFRAEQESELQSDDFNDYFDRIENQAAAGGPFWLGGQDVGDGRYVMGWEENEWNKGELAESGGGFMDLQREEDASPSLDLSHV